MIELWDTSGGETDRIKDTVDNDATVDAIRYCLATARYELVVGWQKWLPHSACTISARDGFSVEIAKTGVIAGVGQVGVRDERTSNSRDLNQTAHREQESNAVRY